MVARTNTLKISTALMCVAWLSACNITDLNPPLDGDTVPVADSGGDSGEATDGGQDARVDAEVEECGGDPKNECGGCAMLSGAVGDTCSGCGVLACDGLEGLLCSCDTGSGCGFDASGQNACTCAEGYFADVTTGECVDRDECNDDVDDCDPLAGCVNTDGGFTCGECPEGTFDTVGDGRKCGTAFEDVELVIANGSNPGNTTECVEATCPPGKVALSGGGEGSGELNIEASRRVGADGSRWVVCGFAPQAAELEVRALCGVPNAEVVELQEQGPVVVGDEGCIKASCPGGYRAVGGGGSWGALGLTANRPTEDGIGWQLCGRPSRADVNVTTSVLCAQVPTNLQRVTSEDEPGSGCLIARCEENEQLVGGGSSWVEPGAALENAPINAGTEWRTCRDMSLRGEWWTEAICVPSPTQ